MTSVESKPQETPNPGSAKAEVTKSEEPVRPTKLFIGGITRHTTTKQLRDHFSQFGRVLDCVAMRQPDGRPRGFGYVTLDSPAAAERCLKDPQVIDERVVDLKPAVPEGSGCSNVMTGMMPSYEEMQMAAWQAEMGRTMPPSIYTGFPDAAMAAAMGYPSPTSSWWTDTFQRARGEALDCMDLLSMNRRLQPPSLFPDHAALLEQNALAMTLPTSPASVTPSSALLSTPGTPTAGGLLSASAQEFVPVGAQGNATPKGAVSTPTARAAPAEAPAPKAAVVADAEKPARVPLGEITNVNSDDTDEKKDVKPEKSANDMVRPALSDDIIIAVDEDVIHVDENTKPENSEVEIKVAQEPEDKKTKEVLSEEEETEELRKSDVAVEPEPELKWQELSEEDKENLPSAGSAYHASGDCKRCNFFAKGRCLNGKDCTFCHFSHEKRKPSRQEKRERRAAWLAQQEGNVSDSQIKEDEDDEEMMVAAPPGLLKMQPVAPGVVPTTPKDESFLGIKLSQFEDGENRTYPVSNLKTLPLTDVSEAKASCATLPPGLPPPGLYAEDGWQPDEEVSPCRKKVMPLTHLGTAPYYPGFAAPASPFYGAMSPSVLATMPTTPASMPATPTATMMPPLSQSMPAASVKEMCTVSTQTDILCPKCQMQENLSCSCNEEEMGSEKARGNRTKQGRQWSREEMLKIKKGSAGHKSAVNNASVVLGTAAVDNLGESS